MIVGGSLSAMRGLQTSPREIDTERKQDLS